MTAALNDMMETMRKLWLRFMSQLDARANSHVAEWGATLQYRRRYTNPDSAKAFRKPLEDVK